MYDKRDAACKAWIDSLDYQELSSSGIEIATKSFNAGWKAFKIAAYRGLIAPKDEQDVV